MKNTELISRAIKLAVLVHQDQKRKDGAPYISHPLIVGMILSQYGFDEETIVAGILHDVIEDTPMTKEDVIRDFGPRVADIVTAVSEDSALPWVARKTEILEQVRNANEATKAVAVADYIANMTDFLQDYKKIGPTLWDRWSDRTAEDKFAHDQRFLEMLQSTWKHPLVDTFGALVQQEKAIIESQRKSGK